MWSKGRIHLAVSRWWLLFKLPDASSRLTQMIDDATYIGAIFLNAFRCRGRYDKFTNIGENIPQNYFLLYKIKSVITGCAKSTWVLWKVEVLHYLSGFHYCIRWRSACIDQVSNHHPHQRDAQSMLCGSYKLCIEPWSHRAITSIVLR